MAASYRIGAAVPEAGTNLLLSAGLWAVIEDRRDLYKVSQTEGQYVADVSA